LLAASALTHGEEVLERDAVRLAHIEDLMHGLDRIVRYEGQSWMIVEGSRGLLAHGVLGEETLKPLGELATAVDLRHDEPQANGAVGS